MTNKLDLASHIIKYNRKGRTYLLKQMTLRECFELKLGDQVFLNSTYSVGVVNSLTTKGFNLIDRNYDSFNYEVDLRNNEYIEEKDNSFTKIYRILREEINPISMEGYVGFLNLLNETYSTLDSLILDCTPSRTANGEFEEGIWKLHIGNKVIEIIIKRGSSNASINLIFEDIIRIMCRCEYYCVREEDIDHKSNLTEKIDLIEKYVEKINSIGFTY